MTRKWTTTLPDQTFSLFYWSHAMCWFWLHLHVFLGSWWSVQHTSLSSCPWEISVKMNILFRHLSQPPPLPQSAAEMNFQLLKKKQKRCKHYQSYLLTTIYKSDILGFTDGEEEERIKLDLDFWEYLGKDRPVQPCEEENWYISDPLKVSNYIRLRYWNCSPNGNVTSQLYFFISMWSDVFLINLD